MAQIAPTGEKNESNFVDLHESETHHVDAKPPRHGLEHFRPFFVNCSGSAIDLDSAQSRRRKVCCGKVDVK